MVNIHICWVLEDPFFNKSSVSTWEQIALLLTDLFLYSYKAEILQKIIKEKIIITEVKVLNIIFRFIGDFLSINNPYFANWILKRTIDDINSFSCTQMTRYIHCELRFDSMLTISCQLYLPMTLCTIY